LEESGTLIDDGGRDIEVNGGCGALDGGSYVWLLAQGGALGIVDGRSGLGFLRYASPTGIVGVFHDELPVFKRCCHSFGRLRVC
jgi:hypothetical protein